MSFVLYADKNKLVVRKRGPVTSGSVNVYPVRFEFSADWDGLTRTAVFQADGEPVSVLLDDTGECSIPWETLAKHGVRLRAGVYGTKGGDVVLPTIWTDLGEILQGVTILSAMSILVFTLGVLLPTRLTASPSKFIPKPSMTP